MLRLGSPFAMRAFTVTWQLDSRESLIEALTAVSPVFPLERLFCYLSHMSIEKTFLDFSVRKLTLLASRLADCLGRLNDEQVWARACDTENAVGNLVMHLCGNVRQWVISGIGGAVDVRHRPSEFAAEGGITASELKQKLDETVTEAVRVIQGISSERLAERLTIQGYDVTVLEAIYTVVEHFAQHTGQVIYATKALTGLDLGYYAHLSKAAHDEKTP